MVIAVLAETTWWLENVEGDHFDDLAVSIAKGGLHTSDEHGPVYIPPQAIKCIRPEFSVAIAGPAKFIDGRLYAAKNTPR